MKRSRIQKLELSVLGGLGRIGIGPFAVPRARAALRAPRTILIVLLLSSLAVRPGRAYPPDGDARDIRTAGHACSGDTR